MRQVAGRGENLVVMQGFHQRNQSAQRCPETLNCPDSIGMGRGNRCQNHSFILIEVGASSFHSTTLGSGDGMARYKIDWNLSEYTLSRSNHFSLDTANIGINRILRPSWLQISEYFQGCTRWCCNDHPIRACCQFSDCAVFLNIIAFVNDTQGQSPCQIVRVGIQTNNLTA